MSASSAAVEPAMRGTGAATRLIIASSVGNALEFYEILVYGYFASPAPRCSFPPPTKPFRFWSRSVRSVFHFWRARSALFFLVPMEIAKGAKTR